MSVGAQLPPWCDLVSLDFKLHADSSLTASAGNRTQIFRSRFFILYHQAIQVERPYCLQVLIKSKLYIRGSPGLGVFSGEGGSKRITTYPVQVYDSMDVWGKHFAFKLANILGVMKR